MKFHLKEWHIYLFLWLGVFLYPVVSNILDQTTGIQWDEVVGIWINFIPFIVVFILHNRLIMRIFRLPKQKIGYLLSTLLLLGAFTFFQYMRFEQGLFNETPPAPPAEEFRGRGDFPEMRDNQEMGFPLDREAPQGIGSPQDRPSPSAERGITQGRPSFPPSDRIRRRPPEGGKTPSYIMDCVIAFLMLGCNLTIMLLFRMQKEQEQALLLEKANLQNELKYLKAQLNPHFLMNMLNNIHTMIEIDAEKAQEMIINFSRLLRYALYESANTAVPLSREVAFISNYVQLMKQRFLNKKIDITLTIPEEIPEEIQIPPLLSIVFIENAFKHGVSFRQESFIQISIALTEDRILFQCRNSVPTHAEKKEVGGIGLENVRKRLDLLFGENYTLDIEATETYYDVKLNTPIII